MTEYFTLFLFNVGLLFILRGFVDHIIASTGEQMLDAIVQHFGLINVPVGDLAIRFNQPPSHGTRSRIYGVLEGTSTLATVTGRRGGAHGPVSLFFILSCD